MQYLLQLRFFLPRHNYVNLADFSCLGTFGFPAQKLLYYFGSPIVWLWAYMLKVIPQTRRTKFDVYVYAKENIIIVYFIIFIQQKANKTLCMALKW